MLGWSREELARQAGREAEQAIEQLEGHGRRGRVKPFLEVLAVFSPEAEGCVFPGVRTLGGG